MKREAKKLLHKALDSLVLSVELFNRPSELGRTTASLLFLDHAMEMFLKASIIERNGSINSKDRPGNKIGFDACVSRCLSDGSIKFLTDEQARLLRMINGQRDAAQHYLVDLSEQILYLHLQSGVSLFRDMLKIVFGLELSTHIPSRVLPISTIPPLNLHMLFDQEVNTIKQMLAPGSRKRIDAEARLRSLIIIDKAMTGGDVQPPSRRDTKRREIGLSSGLNWRDVFPGVAAVDISTEGTGYQINFVINKKGGGIPSYHIAEADSATHDAVIGVQKVNDFDRFSMTQATMAEHLGISSYQAQALIWYLRIKENRDAYKEFKRGTVVIRGYSQNALQMCRNELSNGSLSEICRNYQVFQNSRRQRSK